ncbi:MAG: hypothetical protein JJT94_14095 [Bernardetiaceae bacterium]|nr:hypothetical protein [Bernardetiaceae bacterium]
MENTVWEIYNVSKEISNDSVDDAALGYMLNEKIAGTKIFIAKNKIKIKGNEFDVEANVVKITPEKIFIEENGEEVQIQYFLSSDKRECEFILADGTRLKAKREN